MFLAQGQQHSDAGEAQTKGLSVSSTLPLSHCAPSHGLYKNKKQYLHFSLDTGEVFTIIIFEERFYSVDF